MAITPMGLKAVKAAVIFDNGNDYIRALPKSLKTVYGTRRPDRGAEAFTDEPTPLISSTAYQHQGRRT